jgi:hypothetical protein
MAKLKVLSASKQNASYSDDWSDYVDLPFVQFLIKNSRQIGYGAFVLLVLVILSYRFLAYRSHQTEKDFILAKEAVQSLNNPEKEGGSLLTLQSLLNEHKDLQPKYDGIIGQTLLVQGKTEEAKGYIKRTFNRVKHEASPFDLEFAKTSLLIGEGHLNEALKNAYLLKDKMLEAILPPSTLYAFNLIRIAFLERALKNSTAEQKAWTELKEMGETSSPIKISAHELNKVMTHFDDQGASLKDFIK